MTTKNECDAAWAIGQILPWLEDETLFSWCARYHQLAVNGTPKATAAQLFGRANVRCVHDLPIHINALAARASGSLGTADEIIGHHTILPFYLAFKQREVADHAIRALCESGVQSLKYKLGLLTSGLGAAHPLKACPSCMSEDLALHRTAYWRVAHQLPGVWICPKHAISLNMQRLDLHQSRRFEWQLPSHVALTNSALLSGTATNAATLATRMAECSLRVNAEHAARFSDVRRIARAFRQQMDAQGWLTTGGSVKWKVLSPDLAAFVAQSAQIPQFSLSTDPRLGQAQLARILSGRALTHTLRYLLWICFVFGRWDPFVAAYDACIEAPVSQPRAQASPDEICDSTSATHPGRMTAINLLMSGSKSLTATAAALRVCPSTVASWASKAGITTARRPKKLTADFYSEAVSLLENGADKKVVCQQCAISVVTVTRILRNVPGLQARWHLLRAEKMQANARATWILVTASQRGLGTTAKRSMVPKIYAWLYRNDPAWLRSIEGQQPRQKGDNRAPERMRQADERHAKSLTDWLRSGRGDVNQADQLSSMVTRIPALKKIVLAPDDWPLTISVIAKFMKRVSFAGEGSSETEGSQLNLL